ncbi:conserved hypothetical protein [Bathymodiolus platifrons methanotrophic gill symbiont]|uniref:hypothetical protein n=1 Tax=Bathymodiolus platifrons methanotrophic gill symbiont TaxID=113268 RepID=UPI000B410BD8|nr:hypothetical protein [Bathymodiolus platifrons methanotrophic gill symbiont]GAW87402.1 conserved hypothetical protein [Bathymodiolus platifrons methanotrophic gill symbiont]GFO74258.1 hypothetical protein BPLS_P0822 [Bathymodiolus platifrons methanotrophic gill symbiont]
MQDFFFGKTSQTKDKICQLQLSDVNQLSKIVTSDFFYAQLNRLLLTNNNRVDLYDGTSYPNFPKFIKYLPPENIGLIQIGQRKDVNGNVDATLDCSIILLNGIVRVTAHWCAYKGERANEIVTTLLDPLIESKLLPKVFIKTPNYNENKSLSQNKEAAKKQLFLLSGYPNVIN